MVRKRLQRALVATIGVAALIGVGAPHAMADEQPWNILGRGQAFVAQSGDLVGVCAGDDQLRKGAPLTPASGKFRDHAVGSAIPRNWSTSTGNKDISTVVSADKSWVVAALYHQYANTVSKNSHQAESFSWAVQSQLSAFGRFPMPTLSDGGKLARQMVANAEKIAGPYDFDLWVSYDSRQLHIENIGVRGRSGWIPGLDVELKVTHPVKGEIVHTLKTQGQPVKFDLDMELPGTVEVEAKVFGLPSDVLRIWEHSKHQDLIVVSGKGSTITARGSAVIPIENLTLGIETNVKNETITPDEMPVDLVTVSADSWPVDEAGNPVSVNIRAELYGPFETQPEQADSPPADLEPIATVVFPVQGVGTYETPELPLQSDLEAGYYTWVVSALAEDQDMTGKELENDSEGAASGVNAQADSSLREEGNQGTDEPENLAAGSTPATLLQDFISDFGIPAETFHVVQVEIEEPTTEVTEPTEEPEPTEETTATPSRIERSEVKMLANTGVENLAIPALALASMGLGFLLFRSESRRNTKTEN